jgi:NAD(P)-dependent dehydrogenase (short-subunit alcohol dehydrogenase family)
MGNKTVVVVGGLSGIGRAVAELAAAEGAHVIAAGRRAVPKDWPSHIRTASLDARDEAAVERFFGELGMFDHLVTTIGPVIPSSSLAEHDLDAAKAAFDVKFFGAGMTPGPRPPFGFEGHWLYLDGVPVIHLIAGAS